ncbi:hypothetical protein [Pseudomonas sp. GL-B-19]|uniref:hypothetical protein n=1 Tax=Pseudomonas sp. GL-B-19 TaxID=2832393 RepID=UPI001CC175D4|nr:hypothetical protein [Pseudomonas sp. GL-B-19]
MPAKAACQPTSFLQMHPFPVGASLLAKLLPLPLPLPLALALALALAFDLDLDLDLFLIFRPFGRPSVGVHQGVGA